MITDVNPFIYSHPIAPDDIIDRDDETKRLLTAAVGGHYVRLYVASFVFAGSEPGMMRELFEDESRPLYGAAVPMRLERLADSDLAGYIIGRFREAGRSVGDALNPLVAAAQGHPQRAMLLAHRLWDEVEPEGTATLRSWVRAHGAALAELQPEFDANWRLLSTNAQKALRAVLAGSGSPFQKRVLEQLDLPKSTARAALNALAATATVEQRGDDYLIVDPLFAEWIANLRETSGDESFDTRAQIIECFHLAFIQVLSSRFDQRHYVLKGGANLRYFFNSHRYSEGIDFDALIEEVWKLEENVDEVLDSAAVTALLRSKGVTVERVTKAKLTETTQRWKVLLAVSGRDETISTKIGFSRRNGDRRRLLNRPTGSLPLTPCGRRRFSTTQARRRPNRRSERSHCVGRRRLAMSSTSSSSSANGAMPSRWEHLALRL